MKNHDLLLLFLLVIASSCKTVDLTTMQATPEQRKKLPCLGSEIDLGPINATNVSYTEEIDDEGNVEQVVQRESKNQMATDLLYIFDSELKTNICNQIGTPVGNITCRIMSKDIAYNHAMSYASLLSFGLINLLGAPTSIINAQFLVEVDITSLNGELIKTYTGYGQSKIVSGLYYGYTFSSQYRVAYIEAFKSVLQPIKNEIAQDYDALMTVLTDDSKQ